MADPSRIDRALKGKRPNPRTLPIARRVIAYLGQRLAWAVAVLVAISLAVFLVVHLSGDPTALYLGPEGTKADYEIMRAALGFDRPLPEQYGHFLARAVQGDFGRSLRHRQPTLPLVLERFPATAKLALAAIVLAVLLALPLGIMAAVRRGSAPRLRGDGARAGGPVHAHVLARHPPDPRVRREPPLGAGLRRRGLAHPRPARRDPGRLGHGPDRAHHPLEHARGAEPGLPPDGAGEGHRRAVGDPAARPPQRGDPDRDRDRARAREPPGRRGDHRGGVRLSGRRPAGGGGGRQQGRAADPGGGVHRGRRRSCSSTSSIDLVYTALDPRVRLGGYRAA